MSTRSDFIFKSKFKDIKNHKENDTTRTRNFFDYHVEYLLPLKIQWFSNKENVDFLDVDGKSKDEAGQLVLEWIETTLTLMTKLYPLP